MKTIKVKDEVYTRLVVLRGKLETKKGRIVSLNKVLEHLLNNRRKEE